MLITKNKRILDILKTIEEIVDNVNCILITGETGTGKTELAKYIYQKSKTFNSKLVIVNLESIPENLIDSELFGYKRGAFTDAKEDREGLIESANNGTLVLDEIGDLPIYVQAKFLDVIQERHFKRLGENKYREINLRFISCSNKDLNKMINEKSFREDLYYRLSNFEFKIPPLRERREDIPILVDYFVNIFSKKYNKNIKGISPDFYSVIVDYKWPGNIRELSNVIERIISTVKSNIITVDDIPYDLVERTYISMSDNGEELSKIANFFESLKIFPKLDKIEEIYIKTVLKQVNYNKAKAADILGIDRSSIYRKIKDIT